MTLREERAILAKEELNTYDADAFPGSAPWMKNNKAAKVLRAFDAAHPEILAELKADAEAARTRSFDNLSDFIKSGS